MLAICILFSGFINLGFCFVYNLTIKSEFENVRKKVLNWQSFFKSSLN